MERALARRITGIRPFDELPIDAEIWREAHSHHHLHRLLHAVTAHRPGILWGLEVIASQTRERTVVVAPGVALDEEGDTLVLSEPVSFTLDEPQQVYFVLSFLRAVDRGSGMDVSGGRQYYREVEGRDLKPVKELPRRAYVELGRVYRSEANAAVRDAVSPHAPLIDEINLLYRPSGYPFCHADVGVGELAYVPVGGNGVWNPNRAGLLALLREASWHGMRLPYTGQINLRGTGGESDPALLYVAGQEAFQPLAEGDVDGLGRFLDRGGVLLAETSDGDSAFAGAFTELVGKLGAKLEPLAAHHPLLTCHHTFASPPQGAHSGGKLLADTDAGIFFSTMDYGAAWQGQSPHSGADGERERIRCALEFGMNLAAYAALRRRRRDLARLV